MAAADVKKVLQLKRQLKECNDGHTLLKILNKLEVLDITLEILAETEAGKVAKVLVNRWKALVPKGSISLTEGNPEDCQTQNEKLNKEENESRRKENSRISDSSNSRKKPKLDNSKAEKKSSPIVDIKCKTKSSKYKMISNGEDSDNEEPKKDSSLSQGSRTHGSDHNKEKKHESKKTESVSGVTKKQKKLEKSLKVTRDKNGDACKKDKRKARDQLWRFEDICENPSMSFEAYLSYDLEPPKRSVTEEPITAVHQKQVPEQSVMDLLNVPLPMSLPECEDLSQYQYFSEKKDDRRATEVCEDEEAAPMFILVPTPIKHT